MCGTGTGTGTEATRGGLMRTQEREMGPHLEIRPLMLAILMRMVCQVWMEEMLVPWAVVIGKGHVRLDLVPSSEGSGTEGGKGSGKESKLDARIVNPNCSHFIKNN